MDEARIVKIILPGKCPHCDKDILISTRMLTPAIDWVLKPEDINTAKEMLRKEIEAVEMDDNKRAMITEWLDSQETLFGPEEVPMLKAQLLAAEPESK